MLRISDKNKGMIVSSNHSRLTTKINIRCGVKKVKIKRVFHSSPEDIVVVVVVVVVEPDVVVVLGVVVYLF